VKTATQLQIDYIKKSLKELDSMVEVNISDENYWLHADIKAKVKHVLDSIESIEKEIDDGSN